MCLVASSNRLVNRSVVYTPSSGAGKTSARAEAGRLERSNAGMESRELLTLLHAEAPDSLASVQHFVETLLAERVTPSTVGEIVLRVHGFLCHAETHMQNAAPQTVATLAATSDNHQRVRDALEKLLVSKVYHRVFGVSDGGMERDAALHKRLSGLSHLMCVRRLQPARTILRSHAFRKQPNVSRL